MLHQHRAANRKNERQPETKFDERKKRDGNVSHHQQQTCAPVAANARNCQVRNAVSAPRKMMSASSSGSDARRMNWPVMMELATFQMLC